MKFFGHGKDLPIVKSILENEYLRIETLNLGACVACFVDKKSGKDIALGFDNLDSYHRNKDLHIVGCQGHYSANNGVFINDFAEKIYHVKEESNKVTYYSMLNKRKLSISYILNERNLLCLFTYSLRKGESLVLTNNIYFNLLGSVGRTILAQQLQINSEYIILNNNLKQAINNSAFDFLKKQKIGLNLLKGPSDMTYNQKYLFDNDNYRANLENFDLSLSIYSSFKEMVLKTLACTSVGEGKNNYLYGPKDGVAFLCGENKVAFKDTIYKHYICYHLENNC